MVDEDTLEEDGSQDAELQGLTEDAVYTTMRFSRPFRSCDPQDQDITVKGGGGAGERLSTSSFSSWGVKSPPSWNGHTCPSVSALGTSNSLSLPRHSPGPGQGGLLVTGPHTPSLVFPPEEPCWILCAFRASHTQGDKGSERGYESGVACSAPPAS